MKGYSDFEHLNYHYYSILPRLQPKLGHLWLFVLMNLLPWTRSGAYRATGGRVAIATEFIIAQRTANELDSSTILLCRPCYVVRPPCHNRQIRHSSFLSRNSAPLHYLPLAHLNNFGSGSWLQNLASWGYLRHHLLIYSCKVPYVVCCC